MTIHEYGHFWVARKVGVKVLRFSLGFGKVIWSYTSKKDGVEYALSAIPLGGYVKMLGEGSQEEITDENKHQAFSSKSIKARTAIVLAGPLANLIFAVFAFSILYMSGIDGRKPYVTNAIHGTYAYKAGFQAGDLILKVNNESVQSWAEVDSALFSAFFSNHKLVVDVLDAKQNKLKRTINFENAQTDIDPKEFRKAMGFVRWQPAVVQSLVFNREIQTNYRLGLYLQTNMLRSFMSSSFSLANSVSWMHYDHNVISKQFANSPSSKADLLVNDRISEVMFVNPNKALPWIVSSHAVINSPMSLMFSLNQASLFTTTVPSYSWGYFANVVGKLPEFDISLKINRTSLQTNNVQVKTISLKPMLIGEGSQAQGFIGVSPVNDYIEAVIVKYGFLESMNKSVAETYKLSILMLKVFGKMITGEASRKNVSGLITIAEYSGKSAKYGWSFFLRFLAVISISLGVINLLPIPILDGGHLVYLLIEAVKGSPASDEIRAYGNMLGAILLIALMFLAFYNDFERLLG